MIRRCPTCTALGNAYATCRFCACAPDPSPPDAPVPRRRPKRPKPKTAGKPGRRGSSTPVQNPAPLTTTEAG